MIFTQKETLEDRLIRLLVSSEFSVAELMEKLKNESSNYTIQAVYVALRSLVASESVIKRGKVYFLNEEWRMKVSAQMHAGKSINLSEGESITYHLSSLTHNDLQWKNVVLPLHESQKNNPVFFYNYHYIWIYLGKNRKKSELDYYAAFKSNETLAFCLIGSNSEQDKAVKRTIQNEFVQVSTGKKLFPTNNYKTIIGDYIITNSFSPKFAEEIEDCYKKSPDIETLEEYLQSIGTEKKKIKLTIERNKTKAKSIRKRFSSEFYIPKDLINKFELF